MEYENYVMKKANRQGYRILDGRSVHYCNDPDVVFEWALIDRGEGKTPCVGHWVSADVGAWYWDMENIEWSWGHYFNTLEEAEVYYHEQLIKEMENEIWDLKERLEEERRRLREVRKALPEEEE